MHFSQNLGKVEICNQQDFPIQWSEQLCYGVDVSILPHGDRPDRFHRNQRVRTQEYRCWHIYSEHQETQDEELVLKF